MASGHFPQSKSLPAIKQIRGLYVRSFFPSDYGGLYTMNIKMATKMLFLFMSIIIVLVGGPVNITLF